MRALKFIVGCLFLVGCAQEIVTTVPFSADEVSFINRRGESTISGQAFMRQNGGGIVTCAGLEVELVPAGQYAVQRINGIYGSPQGGRNSLLTPPSIVNVPSEYLSMSKTTMCDADGDFEFPNIANGDYYVIVGIAWTVPGSYIPEGGTLAKLVQIRNGQSTRVILS